MKKILVILSLTFTTLTSIVNAQEIIKNFSKVNNGVYRGAKISSAESAQYLKSLNIKNIINLQGDDLDSDIAIVIPWGEPGETAEAIAAEKVRALAAGIGFLNIPLDSLDEVTPEENSKIDNILEFMHTKKNQPVFIHCEHGVDRTGLIVALYRVKYEGVNVEIARQEWIDKGHNKIHRLFTGVLDDYYYEKVKEFQK